MTQPDTLASLSPSKRRLLRIMQEVNFGRIEGLVVHNGEPVLNPALHIVREIKLGADNGPRPELSTSDFALKIQVVELLEHIRKMGNGIVRCIEIKNGLPFLMSVEDTTQA